MDDPKPAAPVTLLLHRLLCPSAGAKLCAVPVADAPAARTFLFTDLEGSTRTWEREPEAMHRWLARHDEIVIARVTANRGEVFKHTGDGICAVFPTTSDAARAALDVQLALAAAGDEQIGSLRVRVAVHTGEARERSGDFFGPTLNRCARLLETGHGGQVLFSAAAATLLGDEGGGVTLVDMGQHRLRDLQQPERIWQLAATGLERDFPPLRSLDAFVHNLPVQRSSFVGREAERRILHELLGSNRLVTVTGVGGCGKTRLALEVVAGELEHFADGVFFADLSAIAEPNAVASVIAAALRVSPGQGSSEDRLVDFIGDRKALVLIDNCEHLLDACAAVVDLLLLRCPQLVVLTTSREPLSLEGERVWRVPSLSLPSGDGAQEAGESEAVRLFCDRAAAVRSGFSLSADNSAAVVEICRRLDGIPLALELAAARVAHMAPREISQRLTDRFRLLSTGRRGVQRQQTLQAVLDWSHDLLTEVERCLLRRLSVFAGGWDMNAAQAVCTGGGLDPTGIVDVLGALASRSLVDVEDHGESTRYRLLETVRLYGQDRLVAAGEATDLRQAHAECYLQRAEVCDGRDVSVARSWFAYVSLDLLFDVDNLRQAADWFAGLERWDLLARMSITVVNVLGTVGRIDEASEMLEFARAQAHSLPLGVRVRLQSAWAESAEVHGDFLAANERAREAIALAQNPADAGAAYSILVANLTWSDTTAAERLLDRAAEWTTPLGGEADNYVRTARAGIASARRDYDASVALLSQVTSSETFGPLPMDLTIAHLLRGDTAIAEEMSAALAEFGTPTWFAYFTPYCAALIAAVRGDTSAARGELRRAVALVRRWKTALGLADCVVGCAAVALVEGDAYRASELLAAVRAATGGGLRTSMSMSLYRYYVSEVRNKLDDDALKKARAAGAGLSLEAAIERELNH